MDKKGIGKRTGTRTFYKSKKANGICAKTDKKPND